LDLVVKVENASRLALHAAELSGKFGQEGASGHATVFLPQAPFCDHPSSIIDDLDERALDISHNNHLGS
jgi:hypothetical protein